jgi:NAD(P)H dehydrogenase (quinone)
MPGAALGAISCSQATLYVRRLNRARLSPARPGRAVSATIDAHHPYYLQEDHGMAKVLVLYYSTYGHIEQMAQAMAEGARAAGAAVELKRVPETVPEHVARPAHFKLDQQAPIATVDELPDYDAIIIGAPTRYGRMPSQMAAFLDQTGGLWARGALHGKVGAAFTSTATQHGGQETTQFSIITNLLHLGMVVVGLPYSFAGQMTLDEITGCSPYGASTIAGGTGQRQPSKLELDGARFQGELVAKTAAKLFG